MPYTSTSFPRKKPETVIKAIQAFLNWLAQGKCVKSFSYRDPDDANEYCSWYSVVRYMADEEFIKEHGLACVSEQKTISISEGYAIWERVCEASARGDNEKANTASLQMIMRNKFGWDKPDADKNKEPSSNLHPLLEFFNKVSQCSISPSKDRAETNNHND